MTMRARSMLLLLLACVSLSALGLSPVRADRNYTPIQPGAMETSDPDWRVGWGSLNFVFQDRQPSGSGERTLYIGTSGHGNPVGSRTQAPGIGPFGTVVYSRLDMTPTDGLPAMDFSLIRIDDDKRQYVNPSMRYWGGPTHVEETFTPGSMIFQYGNSELGTVDPGRSRIGVLQYAKTEDFYAEYRGWYVAAVPVAAGDSGSPLLTSDGGALGLNITLAVNDKGVSYGPTIALVLELLHKGGSDVDLVTAPLGGLDPMWMAGNVRDAATNCVAHPTSDVNNPDACVRSSRF